VDFRHVANAEDQERIGKMLQTQHTPLKVDHPLNDAYNVQPKGPPHTSESENGHLSHVTVRYFKLREQKPDNLGHHLATTHFNVKVCAFTFLVFLLEMKLLFWLYNRLMTRANLITMPRAIFKLNLLK
jgi:hypothetical protein